MLNKIKWFSLIVLIFILTGCGNIKGESQVIKYVNKKLGATQLIKKEEISDDEVVYTFEDKDDKFSYSCTAYMESFIMDGSTFFTYPSIKCDFDNQYKEYIYNMIKQDTIILNHDLIIELPDSSLGKYDDGTDRIESFDIYTTNLNEEDTYVDMLKKLQELDDREFFSDFALEIFDRNTREKIGAITSKNYKLVTNLEEQDKWFLEYTNRTYSTNGQANSKKINFYIIDYYISGQMCYFNNYSGNVRNKYTEQKLDGCRW